MPMTKVKITVHGVQWKFILGWVQSESGMKIGGLTAKNLKAYVAHTDIDFEKAKAIVVEMRRLGLVEAVK